MQEFEYAALRLKLAKMCYNLVSDSGSDLRDIFSTYPMQAVAEVIIDEGLLSIFASYHLLNREFFEISDGMAYTGWIDINRRDLLIRNQLLSILRSETVQNTNPILLRGLSWQRYYPEPVVRDMADIDLLIRKDDYYKLAGALQEIGWTQHPMYRSVMLNSGVYLDIHSSLLGEENRHSRQFAGDIDIEDVYNSSTSIEIDGVNAKVLDEVDDLICNTTHLVKHSFYKMSRAVDIAMICNRITAQRRWNEVIIRIKQFKLDKLFSYGITVVLRLFDLSVPDALLHTGAASQTFLSKRIIDRVTSGLKVNHAGIVLYGEAIDQRLKRMMYYKEVVIPPAQHRRELMEIHVNSSLLTVTIRRLLQACAESLKLCYRVVFRR